jgi:hypothetical protein
MKNNQYHRRNFETDEDYINALKDANAFHLGRRQLQDLAQHHFENACDDEDWEEARKAWRFKDLAMNMAGGNAETAKIFGQIIIQEMASDEEKKRIDQRLQEIQEKSQRSAQSFADRMNAREDDGDGEDQE